MAYLFETEITLASDSKCTVKFFLSKKSQDRNITYMAVAPQNE
jgi:hypothetical protein